MNTMVAQKVSTQPITPKANIESLIASLKLVKSSTDFYRIDKIVNKVEAMINNGVMLKEELECILNDNQIAFLDTSDSVMGHIRNKPYGYAGDFHIIDRIYTKSRSSQFNLIDEYSLENSAAKAVRNRKTYFKNLVNKLTKDKNHFSILNIASGPCRDIKELLDESDDKITFDITCLDMDSRAIDYAQSLLSEYADRITFINKNILRYSTEKQYDLVWSAGLFDYFDDRVFAHVLKRAIQWVNPDGSLVIGNFNEDHNPSRAYMELFGDWYLNHRTEQQLIDLALSTGANPTTVRVGKEEENVNLFLELSL